MSDETALSQPETDVEIRLRHIHARYRRSLVAVLKRQRIQENLLTLGNLFVELIRLGNGLPLGRLSELGLSIVESMVANGVRLNSNTTDLFRQIDDVLKNLAVKGADGLTDHLPTDLETAMVAVSEAAEDVLPAGVEDQHLLLFLVGRETWALPLAAIECIVRPSRREWEIGCLMKTPRIRRAGQSYRLMTFANMTMNAGAEAQAPAPLLILMGQGRNDEAVALRVDKVIDFRELPVCELGRRFNGLKDVSGVAMRDGGPPVMVIQFPLS